MPIEQRDLLPGPSANRWSGIGLCGGVVWIVGSIGGAMGGLTIVRQTGGIDPVTGIFLVLFVLGLLTLAWATRMMALKARKDVAAGYTTMAQGFYEVERRHSPTGVVMRKAGQPALTREQWEQARRLVREFKEGSASNGAK